MKHLYKGSVKLPSCFSNIFTYITSFVLVFQAILFSASHAMDIIVTDASIMPIIQKAAEEISANKSVPINLIYTPSTKLQKYLEVGNNGDVIISSYQQICQDLSKQGLANSFELKPIIRQNIYCSKPKQSWKTYPKILFFLNEYHNQSESEVQNIANNLNAEVKVVQNGEDYYQTVSNLLKQEFQICGFKPMLRTFNIATDSTQTEYGINYYTCPLIGLEQKTYQILVDYYETQFIS